MHQQKFLIVRLSSLGDIVHTYPMVYDIKANFPDCTIDWLVDEDFVSLIKLNPLVDNVISIPLRKWKKNKLKLLSNIKIWRKGINNLDYDYIIDSQGLLKSAVLAKCFKGAIHGLGKNSIREKAACLFYSKKHEIGKEHLAITKNRLLAASIFNYKIDTSNANFGLASAQYHPVESGIDGQYVIFFHATSKDSKKLSMEIWAELATYLISKYNLTILLPYGNNRENGEAQEIKNLINSPKALVPDTKFDFAKLSGLINKADFVFGVDTGLIHLANALNKRLIAIYVDTDPDKTGIFESGIAKNIGGKNTPPDAQRLINLFEEITKV